MWRKTGLRRSQFVESKINHSSDDNEWIVPYHGCTVMCIVHIDDR